MYCKNCGNLCESNAKFCEKCGAPISDDFQSEQNRPPYQQNQYENTYNQPIQSIEYANNNTKSVSVFIEKARKTKLLTLIASVMAIISQIATAIFIIIYFNMDSVDTSDSDAYALPIMLFISMLIINVPSFFFFLKMNSKISNFLNSTELSLSSSSISVLISSINSTVVKIIMVINIIFLPAFVTLPLGIIQVIAGASILNLKKFYKVNESYFSDKK